MRELRDAVQQGDSAESSNWPSTGGPAGSSGSYVYRKEQLNVCRWNKRTWAQSASFFSLVVCYDTYTAYAFSGKGVKLCM